MKVSRDSESHPKSGGLSSIQKRTALDTPLRKTGIRFCDEMPWGTHVCLFYETTEDLLETNAAYIKAGLHSNEYCIWATSAATEEQAWTVLQREMPTLDRRVAGERLEIFSRHDWYPKGGQLDSKGITKGWHKALQRAQDRGFDGIRITGKAFWLESKQWPEFGQYERELSKVVEGRNMLVLCTYPLGASRSVDLLDVARAHHFTIARRHGEWQFLETPELREAKREIRGLSEALSVLSKPFAGHKTLTERERIVLAQVVRGSSNKEIGRWLNVSYRTIEFHRANIMSKLGAKNTADLVRKVTARAARAK